MSDSESSSSENFEDAVESVEISQSPTSKAKRNTMKRGAVSSAEVSAVGGQVTSTSRLTDHQLTPEIEDQIEILTGDQLAERDGRWRRLENLRLRRGEVGAEEGSGQDSPLNVTCDTPTDSRESSVEGIYLSGVRSHHPFKVVECDSRSVRSDGKSVRGGGSVSAMPDIVPSSKPAAVSAKLTSPVTVTPVENVTVMGPPALPLAPPRKKKVSTSSITPDTEHPPVSLTPSTGTKNKPSSLGVESLGVPHPIPSPASTVASITKDLEKQLLKSPTTKEESSSVHNLNISSATRGEYVVRPQDEESRRGETERKLSSDSTTINQDPAGPDEDGGLASGRGSMGGVSRRKDGYTSGGSGSFHSGGSGGYHSSRSQAASGRGSGESRKSGSGDSGMMKQMNLFIRTKSDSGNRLTDQELLKQIKVKNLDDGTELDLATAEDRMPKYTNPLSQHIMRLRVQFMFTSYTNIIFATFFNCLCRPF